MGEDRKQSRVGTAVDAVEGGARAARERALHVGHEGAEAYARAVREVERKLAERGVSAEQVQELIAQLTHETGEDVTKALHELGTRSRKLRKELAKSTKETRKELARNTRRARKALAARIEPEEHRGGPRWWLILVVIAVAAGAVAAVRTLRMRNNATDSEPDIHDISRPDNPGTERDTAD